MWRFSLDGIFSAIASYMGVEAVVASEKILAKRPLLVANCGPGEERGELQPFHCLREIESGENGNDSTVLDSADARNSNGC